MKRMFNEAEAEQLTKKIMEKEIKELKRRLKALEAANKKLAYLLNAPTEEDIWVLEVTKNKRGQLEYHWVKASSTWLKTWLNIN